MVRAIVAGAAGRMGGRIIHGICQSKGTTLAAAFERPDHPCIGQDVGQMVGLGNLGIKVAGSLEEVSTTGEVLIDFTTPEATLKNTRVAFSIGLSMVVGTTGISGDTLNEITRLRRESGA